MCIVKCCETCRMNHRKSAGCSQYLASLRSDPTTGYCSNWAISPLINLTEKPTGDQIKAVRKGAGLNQQETAKLLHCSVRAYQYWEQGEVNMPRAEWELFLIKTGTN